MKRGQRITIGRARYANPDHTSAVVFTEELGNVACSERDQRRVWGALMMWGGEIKPYAPGEQDGETVRKAEEQAAVDRDEPRESAPSGDAADIAPEPAAPPPPSEPEPMPEPTVGNWRLAIERMRGDDGPEEDFGIGQELEPEELPPLPEPQATEEPVIEEKPKAVIELPPPPPPPPAEPQISKTVVIAEQKTIDDSTWGKAQIAYETAIQAKNGSAIHKGLLVEPASRRNMSVEDLADEIIRRRHETVQRVMSEF